VQQVDEPRRNDRRVARRLEHDRVTGDDRGRGHADHDRAGEIPRRYHRTNAERNVDQLVLLAVKWHDGLRLRVAERFTRVEFQKVDRFGDVAVGLGPALPHFVHEQRVVFEAPFAQPLCRLE
jgi:hypothetical protein